MTPLFISPCLPSSLTSLLCVLSFLLCVWSLNAMPFVKGHDIAYQLKPCVPALHNHMRGAPPLIRPPRKWFKIRLRTIIVIVFILVNMYIFSGVFKVQEPDKLTNYNIIYRGIPVSLWQNYSKKSFTCFSPPTKTIPASSINDEYCDCDDGSDERGTNACPRNQYGFYCHSTYIFSAFVNDGICDCCDGTDEYEKKVECLYTCGGPPDTTPLPLRDRVEDSNDITTIGMYIIYGLVGLLVVLHVIGCKYLVGKLKTESYKIQ